MNTVPVSKIAAAALRQVSQAEACFPASYHDTEKAAKAKVHLQVATELLALIAEPRLMVNVRDDGSIDPPPSPGHAPAPLVRGLDD